MIQRTVLLFVIALVGCGPIEQTPGLRLGGTESEIPTSFDFVSEHPLIQLEARGAVLPRVVNLWGVGLGDAMYVWTSPDTGWGQRVAKRPDVRDLLVNGEDRHGSCRLAPKGVLSVKPLERTAQVMSESVARRGASHDDLHH